MNKKIEETFNLPPLEEVLQEENIEESYEEEQEVPSTALVEQKKSGILANVKEDEHDKEVDEVRQKALSAYDDIMEVGRNVNPERSARLFEVAGQFLRTGLDASNSKSEKQLKAAKLKIEAARLKVSNEMVDQINSGREVMADRNELLKQMMAESKKDIVDVEAEEEITEE